MRILITNHALKHRAGSELYVRDLATALLRRGHTPVAYSTVLGEVATELRRATVPVVDDLNAVGAPPDLIHGHHHHETMQALLHFPGVPAVYVCHGWSPWAEAPPLSPRVHRYVAVDRTCRDRLVLEHGIPENRTALLRNFVDLERFRPRDPLPARPRRALVLSNYAEPGPYLDAVEAACTRAGIALDVYGTGIGRPTAKPERLLPQYDLVFAKARAALEALAVGAAVIVADARGAGPMVTSAELEHLRDHNFGVRVQKTPVTADHLAAQIARYDPADTALVSDRIRATAGLDAAVDAWLRLYDDVRGAAAPAPDEELRTASRYLRWLGQFWRQDGEWTIVERVRRLERDLSDERSGAEGLRDTLAHERHAWSAERARLADEVQRIDDERARLDAERTRLTSELALTRGTATFRFRERVLRSAVMGTPTRLLVRLAKTAGLYR